MKKIFLIILIAAMVGMLFATDFYSVSQILNRAFQSSTLTGYYSEDQIFNLIFDADNNALRVYIDSLGTVTIDTLAVDYLTIINAIDEISIDGTFADNSDSAVPTEKATKGYVDTAISGISTDEIVASDNANTKVTCSGTTVTTNADGVNIETVDSGGKTVSRMANNVYLQWRNAAGDAWLDVLKVDTSNRLVFGIQALFQDGTLAAPGIAFASSPGTGLYLNSSFLQLVVGGTLSLHLSSGSVQTRHCYPISNNSYTSGSTDRYWSNVYSYGYNLYSGGKIRLDGSDSGDTYIESPSSDVVRTAVGGVNIDYTEADGDEITKTIGSEPLYSYNTTDDLLRILSDMAIQFPIEGTEDDETVIFNAPIDDLTSSETAGGHIDIGNEHTFSVIADGDDAGGIQNIRYIHKAVHGAAYNLKTIEEEVTIPVGSGSDPVVLTTGNLAPANSLIEGIAFRVTDAPGGGATELDIGITGGDLDGYIDGASCDVLGETGDFYANGSLTAPVINRGAATTLTLTTDADVTDDDMKVRVIVFYKDFTVPTE